MSNKTKFAAARVGTALFLVAGVVAVSAISLQLEQAAGRKWL